MEQHQQQQQQQLRGQQLVGNKQTNKQQTGKERASGRFNFHFCNSAPLLLAAFFCWPSFTLWPLLLFGRFWSLAAFALSTVWICFRRLASLLKEWGANERVISSGQPERQPKGKPRNPKGSTNNTRPLGAGPFGGDASQAAGCGRRAGGPLARVWRKGAAV